MSNNNNNQEPITPTNHHRRHSPEEDEEEAALLLYRNQLQEQETNAKTPAPTSTPVVGSSSSSFFDDPYTANRFSLLRLNSFPPSPSPDADAAATTTSNHQPCTSCGCNGAVCLASSNSHSHKRRSPEPSSAAQEPKLKKPNNGQSLDGFKVIPLSIIADQTQPALRRCLFDPLNPPNTAATQIAEEPSQSPAQQSAEMVCPLIPLSAARAYGPRLPPRAPTLRRSVSDPTPSPAKTISSSCEIIGENESFEFKRLRKAYDFMSEMNRKWEEILHDREDGCVAETNNNRNNNETTTENEKQDTESEEAVSVEKVGECLIIDFKCPCSSGYKILLSGGNCYYKLI